PAVGGDHHPVSVEGRGRTTSGRGDHSLRAICNRSANARATECAGNVALTCEYLRRSGAVGGDLLVVAERQRPGLLLGAAGLAGDADGVLGDALVLVDVDVRDLEVGDARVGTFETLRSLFAQLAAGQFVGGLRV